jgi:hypothetical protein
MNADHSNNNIQNNDQQTSYVVTQIQIRNAKLVAIVENEQELVCLAQLSCVLLKDYNYNQINNRRMALGIEAHQPTIEQLDVFKQNGAMPTSLKRSGIIHKRDAERLVRSFLEENQTFDFPKNLVIIVEHEFGWGMSRFCLTKNISVNL